MKFFNPLLSGLLFSGVIALPASAQITTDGTTSTTVTTTETGVQIDNGDRAGGNLFHSFGEFSIPTGSEAFFNNANEIVNIFSRVTGGNISNIDGILRANGTANLFLINPAGIVFGSNARLQLGGSFYGSTADSIVFPDGEFSAVDIENPPLITINAPIGLNFREETAGITVRGNGNGIRQIDSEVIDTQEALRVDSNATIGLIGGELAFEDATIKTAGGSIELGSVAGGTVDLVETANGFSFDYATVENFSDISLAGISILDASGLGSGSINVAGNNISITGVSGFISLTLGSNPGNDINVFAAESLSISGVENELEFLSGIFNRVLPQGTADAGDINIETGSLVIGDRAAITTFLAGQGNAGDININATENVSLISEGNPTAITSIVDFGAIGNAGDININTPNLTLRNGAFLSSNTSGQGSAGNINFSGNSLNLENGAFFSTNVNSAQGNAGNITVNATDTLSVDGNGFSTGFFSNVFNLFTPENLGNGGAINITTGTLNLSNGATLSATTSGQGNAGNITLNATENMALDGQDSFVQVSAGVDVGAVGNGGAINITTGSLTMENTVLLNTRTSGQGNAGNVTVNATENMALDGHNSFVQISTGVDAGAVGNGGAINITTGSLTMLNDATLSTSSSGDGNAGNVIVNASGNVSFDGQENTNGILSNTLSGATGRSGDIELNANSLTLNGSKIDNSSVNQVGDISLNATENISFANNSGIFTTGAGQGSITIEAKNLEIISDSVLFAGIGVDSGSAEAQAGDIVINLTEDLSMDGTGSELLTSIANFNFGTGNAGNIEINARNISLLNGGQITSNSSGQGNIGSITLNATKNIIVDGSDNFNSQISQFVDTEATGNVGNINLQAQNLTLTNGGQISSGVAGIADSGDINIAVADTIIIDSFAELTQSDGTTGFVPSEINSVVGDSGNGNSGDIDISTNNLLLSRNGRISSTIAGEGNAGNININASLITIGEQGNTNLPPSNIRSDLIGVSTSVEEAIAGNITITIDSLSIQDGGIINADARSPGNGGNIQITATDNVTIDGTGIVGDNDNSPSNISASVLPEVGANGGDIEINTGNLSLTNEGRLSTSSAGDGNAGNITLNVADTFFANNSSFVLSNMGNPNGVVASGKVGNIIINAENIDLNGNAQIQAGAFSGATVEQPGIVSLNATESISFTGENTGIFSNNDPGSFGDASDTRLSAPKIALNDGAGIIADNQANGQGGNITVETERLTLRNDSSIIVNTLGEGNAGSVTINAMDSVLLTDVSSIEAIVGRDATGDGGNITVETEELTLHDGSQISATTFGEGDAGSLTINAAESINLSGTQELFRSGLLANALIGNGTGGDIFVSTEKLTIDNGATITVSNFTDLGAIEPGTGEAGSLRVEANSVTLNSDAIIDAATQSGNGGNITFAIADNLVLRNNNLISARALNQSNGGNINIDAEFIIASPNQNNDIIANAQQGRGGNINITAESLFGIEERGLNPRTNDINASSDFGLDGTVSISTPDTNALRATAELPVKIVTSDVVTSNACSASQAEETSGLVVQGKGGVPPQPTQPFEGEVVIVEEQNLIGNTDARNQAIADEVFGSNTHVSNPNFIPSYIQPVATTDAGKKLYLARGVIKQADGTIVLTSYPTNSHTDRDAINYGDCQ